MTTLHEAAKLAVLPLESAKLLAREEGQDHLVDDINAAIEALRSALAQQGEPVAWYDEEMDCAYTASELDGGTSEWLTPLYAAAAPQQVVKTPPEWWPAVENILTEYGLDAISFVADFKKASGDYPAQIKQDISVPQTQQLLTCGQIKAGRIEGYDAEDAPDAWDFEQGVRFAERHHGIGVKK